ncbi:MAG: FAD-dependent oxidoreductase [Comamonadaceae bacterium]|nr:MAG: FAD-dependent oxidoreductase [Comamonadaceae bacterium]
MMQPAAWAGRGQWRILAMGFGPGRDFLAAWDAWRKDPQRPGLLHFVAIEPRPADPADLCRLPELEALCGPLRAQWRGLVPGFHRLAFEGGRVLLTLCVGEAAAMLRELDFRADGVFLDGLHPTDLATLKAITRLCRRDASLSTPAADASLRQDLQTCGWQLESPVPGRDGLFARYAPAWQVKGLQDATAVVPGHAVVIGAGLAGAAAAASLARRGWKVRVLDAAAAPASGASALPAGLLAPHQSPDDNLLSRLSRAGVRLALQEARQRLAERLEWEATGVLEWRGDDARPLPALGDALGVWSREASAAQKSAAGLAADTPAWWHENAAWIEPAALVRSWLREPGVQFVGGRRVARITRNGPDWQLLDLHGNAIAEAPLVVVAAAIQSAPLLDGRIALHPVRGQVTWAAHGDDAAALPPFPVNGHGHFLPRVGSRGLTFAALCGELLAARLHGEPLPVEARLAQALDAARQLGSG